MLIISYVLVLSRVRKKIFNLNYKIVTLVFTSNTNYAIIVQNHICSNLEVDFYREWLFCRFVYFMNK